MTMDFGEREIFVDLIYLKKLRRYISLILGILLAVFGSGMVFSQQGSAFRFLAILVTFGLIINWFVYYYTFKYYKFRPYLILNKETLMINDYGKKINFNWKDVLTIDQRKNVYFIQTAQHYFLSNYLLSGKVAEIVILLKRYAEKYGTAKFIY